MLRLLSQATGPQGYSEITALIKEEDFYKRGPSEAEFLTALSELDVARMVKYNEGDVEGIITPFGVEADQARIAFFEAVEEPVSIASRSIHEG